jgi:hypothetical protein
MLFCEVNVLVTNSDYCEFFLGFRNPVLLRNSPPPYGRFELPFSTTINVAADMYRPIVMLPSVPGDAEKTISVMRRALGLMRESRFPKGDPMYLAAPRFMAVAEGRTWDEFWECYKIASTSGAVLVGIPAEIKFAPPDGKDDVFMPLRQQQFSDAYVNSIHRARLLTHLHTVHRAGLRVTRAVRHHLVGMEHPTEMQYYGPLGDFVFSAHSTLPFRAGVRGLSFFSAPEGYSEQVGLLTPITPIPKQMEGYVYDTEAYEENALTLMGHNLTVLRDLYEAGAKARRSIHSWRPDEA